MSDKHKKSVAAALHRHLEKQAAISSRVPRGTKNAKPEKEVEKACLDWMRSRGWSVNIFEAKANWNPNAGAWVQQGMKAGTVDCLGSDEAGHSVAIEFKAPGRLGTVNSDDRYLQRKFIVDKINANCFACVTDSVSRLIDIYERWRILKMADLGAARTYLLSMIPESKKKGPSDDGPLFD